MSVPSRQTKSSRYMTLQWGLIGLQDREPEHYMCTLHTQCLLQTVKRECPIVSQRTFLLRIVKYAHFVLLWQDADDSVDMNASMEMLFVWQFQCLSSTFNMKASMEMLFVWQFQCLSSTFKPTLCTCFHSCDYFFGTICTWISVHTEHWEGDDWGIQEFLPHSTDIRTIISRGEEVDHCVLNIPIWSSGVSRDPTRDRPQSPFSVLLCPFERPSKESRYFEWGDEYQTKLSERSGTTVNLSSGQYSLWTSWLHQYSPSYCGSIATVICTTQDHDRQPLLSHGKPVAILQGFQIPSFILLYQQKCQVEARRICQIQVVWDEVHAPVFVMRKEQPLNGRGEEETLVTTRGAELNPRN